MTNTPLKQTKTIGTFLSAPSNDKFLSNLLQERKADFVSNLIAMSSADNKLAECDPKELMTCALNATALNLPLNKSLGFAYVIPYKNFNGDQVPQFQIGYKGLIQLAIRTGAYKYINAVEIREGEIKRNKLTTEVIFLRENPKGEIIGYLAILELKTGFTSSFYMTVDEIEAHALRFSKAYQYDIKYKKKASKWSEPEARLKMALKTVLKALITTYGIISTELATAISVDTETEDQRGQRSNIQDVEPIPQAEPQTEPEKINL